MISNLYRRIKSLAEWARITNAPARLGCAEPPWTFLVYTVQNGSMADFISRRSPFVYIFAGTSIPNALKSVTMSPSEAFSI